VDGRRLRALPENFCRDLARLCFAGPGSSGRALLWALASLAARDGQGMGGDTARVGPLAFTPFPAQPKVSSGTSYKLGSIGRVISGATTSTTSISVRN
jgi:hypothetical protein